ncbi:MAG: NADH-quinone oxidoreductase subunit A [Bacteroidetes bacterium]|nr:MAG: NADH-quinone oxidoreductase subunit A [Bacteroidota bacterium]
MGISSLILLAVCGSVFCGMGILISKWIAPTSKNSSKLEAYECGVPAESGSWVQYNVGYYLFALIFLIFDVEIVFLFPWATVLREVGMVAFVEILIFVFILFLGLLYAWKKGALKWE